MAEHYYYSIASGSSGNCGLYMADGTAILIDCGPDLREESLRAGISRLDAVLLTPGCSDPLYRRSARVSMGTVFQIPWTYTDSWPEEGMAQLERLGFKTAAMALSDDSVSIDNPRLMAEEKLAVVLGSEGDGLTANTIAKCDYTVKIPMYHGVDSLNVAAASAVAFWQLRKG